MSSPRSTPFIASWETEDALDATAPLDELVAAPATPPRAPTVPSAGGPSRLAWCGIGVAGLLAAVALLWANSGVPSRAPAIERAARVPPAPVRAELQAIAARVDMTPPSVSFAAIESPIPLPRVNPTRTARPAAQPRGELAAALLERRKQMSQDDVAAVDVEAVADIRFDPTRRSARVVYRAADSATQIVEYWAVRDGRWQAID